MAFDAQSAAAAVEEATAALESVEAYVPKRLQDVIAAVLGTLAVVAVLLGLREWFVRRTEKRTHACARCGNEATAAGAACGECEGTGEAEEELEETVTCPHCEGEGIDPCHECNGEGCDACGMDGVTKSEKEPDGVKCCKCLGRAEQDIAAARKVKCAACGGTGKAAQ